MDNVAHSLWGLTFVRRLNLLFPIILFSNFPDILSAPFFLYFIIKDKYPLIKSEGIKNLFFPRYTPLHEWNPPREYLEIYRFFHSIPGFIVITIVFNVFFPKYVTIFAICYLLHIIIDVFSHGGIWATRIFYPFSDFHLIWTKNHWHSKNIRRFNYFILLLINIEIFVTKYHLLSYL